MTDAASDHVTIRCPACGASEAADPAVLADAPTIVCRNCGETWPVGQRRRRRALSATAGEARAGTALIEAERRPLITFSDGAEKAWAAKIDGDILPEAPRQSRFASMAMTTAGLAAILFIGVLLGGRQAAVAALPDLAGLYAAVGLPVNLDGLAIESVTAERSVSASGSLVTVRGQIHNLSGVGQAARPLVVAVTRADAAVVVSRDFNAPAADIAAGKTSPFQLQIQNIPEGATGIVVRFRRASEPWAGGAAAP